MRIMLDILHWCLCVCGAGRAGGRRGVCRGKRFVETFIRSRAPRPQYIDDSAAERTSGVVGRDESRLSQQRLGLCNHWQVLLVVDGYRSGVVGHSP